MLSKYRRKVGSPSPGSAEKWAVIYIATFPDGTTVEKKSFQVKADRAFFGCYRHGGRWVGTSVVEEPQPNWGAQIFVEAKRKVTDFERLPRDFDEQGEWPISKYVGRQPNGHWEFIRFFQGTKVEALRCVATLQAEDLTNFYRLWDHRIM